MEVHREDTVIVDDPQRVEVVFADGEREMQFDNEVTQVRVVDVEDNNE